MAFVKITEQPSLYDNLEKKSVLEILQDINTEDQKVALAVKKAIPQIEKLVSQIVPRMKQGGRIFYMGAGTSGRLGVLDASEIPPTFGMPPTLVIGLIAGGDTALRNPVENAEDDMNRGWEELKEHNINEKDTVIRIAASGTTPYVIGALHAAREHGILTGSISSNPDSPISKEADVAIEMIAGMGMTVGQEVFDTCVWIGRFWQTVLWQAGYGPTQIFRREEKLDLCGSLSAKDANIRQAKLAP